MGNRSYSGPVLGDVVGAAAWGSKIYTLRGGLDGCIRFSRLMIRPPVQHVCTLVRLNFV